VSDGSPGITRIRHKPRGSKPVFTYRTPTGQRVQARATLARIQALAIPPAYEDVWICPHPRGHLQATGRDARGRKQYRYHAKWRLNTDEIKHARMHSFGRALPMLRRVLRTDLRKPGLPREKVLALVLSLLDATHTRVGNVEYARSNGSFGLTTLRDRHAKFARNGAAYLQTSRKGGTVHDIRLHNKSLAALVRKCQHLPGQQLFQYLDDEGGRHAIDSGQINQYLRAHLGADYSAKDFRTWHATWRAFQLLLAMPRPDPPSNRAYRQALMAVVKQVAAELRNTPAVCRKSYINPLVLNAWQEGKGPFSPGHAPRSRGTGPLLRLLRQSS